MELCVINGRCFFWIHFLGGVNVLLLDNDSFNQNGKEADNPYVWKKDLWARLLEDMEFVVKTNKPHFLGSIILKEGRKPNPGELFSVRKTVVDGQQRLTTFLIFMKVLCLKQNQALLFDYQFRIMGQGIALRHGRNDIDAFEKVMAMQEAVEIENPTPGSRIIEAFNYFVAYMDATKLDIMSIRTNTQFVKIDLDADEDEQQIFDTINSLGVNLTTSELLKNYFFSRETVNEYESKWASIFEKDDESKAYWDAVIETGRIQRAMIDIFFDSYFQLFIQDKKYSITNEDKLMYTRVDKLAKSYQHFTLGNLAIIPQSLNASIRDAAWKTKRAGKGDNKPGLDRCAKGLCTLQEALEKEEWNEREIGTRAEWLFDNARAIWSL